MFARRNLSTSWYCPAFVFTPQPAGNFAGHGGDALFVLFVDIHSLACKHPIEDQVLNLMGNQLMCHGGEVQLAKVDVPKQTLPLLAGFRRNVVGVALILALERRRVFCNIDIDPLLVVVKEDAESWFGHGRCLSLYKVRALYNQRFRVVKILKFLEEILRLVKGCSKVGVGKWSTSVLAYRHFCDLPT